MVDVEVEAGAGLQGLRLKQCLSAAAVTQLSHAKVVIISTRKLDCLATR